MERAFHAGQRKKVADAVRLCRMFSSRPDSLLCAGPSVVNVYINYEKKFAFVEFRTGALSPLMFYPLNAWGTP